MAADPVLNGSVLVAVAFVMALFAAQFQVTVIVAPLIAEAAGVPV